MQKSPEVYITFDCNIYSKEAVLKACYQLADMAVFDVSSDKNKITVSAMVHSSSDTSADELSNSLKTSVIDYQLREKIEAQTKQVKDIFINAALSNALRT
ncbi:His-Xaa-Ser system protein HxsD [Shewanella bicestrii]